MKTDVSAFTFALRCISGLTYTSRNTAERKGARGVEGSAGAPAGELALIARAAEGDQAAFHVIVLTYEPRLLAYLFQMLGDMETARDLAQETFLAAYRALPRWRLPERASSAPQPHAAGGPDASLAPMTLLSPWLYRIATNRALSWLRSRPPEVRAEEAVPLQASWTVEAPSLDERFAARELLRSALRQLSEDDAACLVLHFVASERYAEIGERLGMSGEAVRKRIARALVALRAAYRKLDAEVLA